MKKLVVLLVVVVFLLALSAPVFAFGGIPAAHDVTGQEGGLLISLVVRNQCELYGGIFDRAFFVEHVSTWKPGLE